jgi:hypothetical protein
MFINTNVAAQEQDLGEYLKRTYDQAVQYNCMERMGIYGPISWTEECDRVWFGTMLEHAPKFEEKK